VVSTAESGVREEYMRPWTFCQKTKIQLIFQGLGLSQASVYNGIVDPDPSDTKERAMAKRLLIRDLSLRDGQQSQFATRMNQAQVDRVLPLYKKAGFYALEVWGGAVPDSVMRYLDENPWTRLESF
jgi:hypothetical protein